MADGVRYIKIAKIDKNGVDQTNSLQSLNQITIPYSTGNVTYNILNITEQPTYFVYYVVNPNIEWDDRADIEYNFTGSFSTSSFSPFIARQNFPILNSLYDNLGFYDSTSQKYVVKTYPQKTIEVLFSGSVTTNGTTGNLILYLRAGTDGPQLNSISIPAGSTNYPFALSASIDPLSGDLTPGESILPRYSTGSPSDITLFTLSSDTRIYITSTSASGPEFQSIPEPFFEENFEVAYDCQPLLNNATIDRKSGFWQDVDYSTGALIPTNFDLLISGNAQKADVQDSNYTLKRHTNPRYDGSKSTSQFLNKWTEGDQGTFGKIPTVESLKTYVAYCDTIGGYAPEKMNTSGVIIKYLISEDGTLVTPNTSENVLELTQGTFQSGETIKIKSLSNDSTNSTVNKTLFRGGAQIEPILTNQIGHPQTTTMSFADTISFTDDNPNNLTTVLDFTATLKNSANVSTVGVQTWSGIAMNSIMSSGSDLPDGSVVINQNYYSASQELVNENVDLIFQINLDVRNNSIVTSTAYSRLARNRGGTVEDVSGVGYVNGSGYINAGTTGTISQIIPISKNQIQAGDRYQIQMMAGHSSVGYLSTSTFKISQNPLPTPPISCSGLFYTSSLLPNSIVASSSALLQYYDNLTTHQKDIDGSGFNPITQPFTIQPGDEFRFEGDETKSFMVQNVTLTSGSLPGPRLIIRLDSQISGSNINLDQFLLRRYVETPGAMIFNGLKPSGFNGPYLITPQYISNTLNENIDNYISDFTQKGLL